MGSLKKYKSKRQKDTPEPKGKRKKGGDQTLQFVIQKHRARQLHYDLRLELDGVLKSWAVPKGPPKTLSDKRLAIMVEDHPYDYKDFEGEIPKGSYGAGSVEIWDHGTYVIEDAANAEDSEKKFRAGLRKGHVSFVLNGERLNGPYSLVKMKSAEDNAWLFLKSRKDKKTKKKVNDPFPRKISPMLATLVERPFNKEGWIFEIKWDGYRALTRIEKSKVELLSRNLKSLNEKFPEIIKELKKLQDQEVILDGEVVALDSDGKANFLELREDVGKGKRPNLYYYVFDLLYSDGQDFRDRPLIERKEALEVLLKPLKGSHVRYCDHVEKKGVAFFKEAARIGIEGIIAKNANSTYQMKRSTDWQKIKTVKRQEFVIGGYTEGRGPREDLGALLVGFYDGKKLQYAGRVGTGFDAETRKTLLRLLRKIVRKQSPFASDLNVDATFVKPQLVCEVSFAQWTKNDVLRQPVFRGLREDKSPKDVVKEEG